METLEKLIEKIWVPLHFAADDHFERLPLIKNLEEVVTSLCAQLRMALPKGIPDSKRQEITEGLAGLESLLAGLAALPPEEKQRRLTAVMDRFSALAGLMRGAAGQPAGPENRHREAGATRLASPLTTIRGIGPRLSALLARKGVTTIGALLYDIPRRYEDRRQVFRIPDTLPGKKHTIMGMVTQADFRYYGRRRIFTVIIDDGHGLLEAKWFKGREAYLRSAFRQGRRVILSGTVQGFGSSREMVHPDFELLDDHEDQLLHFKRIVPVYSETEGLPQKTIRRIIWQVLRDYADDLPQCLPAEIVRKRSLLDPPTAVRQVHFPTDDQDLHAYQERHSAAHRTLIYEEFFLFELSLAMRSQKNRSQGGIVFPTSGEGIRQWVDTLPFILTSAQRRVIGEIEQDMTSGKAMNRLLQGDVGSGKTVVAMAAIVIACNNGYQAALMAPTELLAEQHYRTLRPWCEAAGLQLDLLTGSLETEAKNSLKDRLWDGTVDIVIGTHAMIQEGTHFRKLGLVIIDEQHRFGVVQRGELRRKGLRPHLLLMTATPIPRTLAMTLYGDLDVSLIDELPPGKKPVRTKVFTEAQRMRVYEIIGKELQRGHQVFIIYPLATESEMLSLKDATGMAEHLRRDIFPESPVGLIHGRMKRSDQQRVMEDFLAQKIHILVSTTVIEVGIDVPTASLMVIEHAERFGLSQLHQLRGRVGRSAIPSACILLAGQNGSAEARRRLRVMEETHDGFRIAEEDLAIRGAGEFLGTRQAGLPDFRLADLIRDDGLLRDARGDAFALVDEDPQLASIEHQTLQKEVFSRWGNWDDRNPFDG